MNDLEKQINDFLEYLEVEKKLQQTDNPRLSALFRDIRKMVYHFPTRKVDCRFRFGNCT